MTVTVTVSMMMIAVAFAFHDCYDNILLFVVVVAVVDSVAGPV